MIRMSGDIGGYGNPLGLLAHQGFVTEWQLGVVEPNPDMPGLDHASVSLAGAGSNSEDHWGAGHARSRAIPDPGGLESGGSSRSPPR